ncbi:hypothetical protein ILYODFUR_017348, partial [Ilyodon furcidens]
EFHKDEEKNERSKSKDGQRDDRRHKDRSKKNEDGDRRQNSNPGEKPRKSRSISPSRLEKKCFYGMQSSVSLKLICCVIIFAEQSLLNGPNVPGRHLQSRRQANPSPDPHIDPIRRQRRVNTNLTQDIDISCCPANPSLLLVPP